MANVQIFIPTYNRSKQLKDAVFSCLNQTYKDINVVILDNHSSDDTESLVNNLMQLDNRIRYFKNIENTTSYTFKLKITYHNIRHPFY